MDNRENRRSLSMFSQGVKQQLLIPGVLKMGGWRLECEMYYKTCNY